VSTTTTKLRAAKNHNNNNNVVALLHSHHLLDHKPDNLLLKGGKYKLRGFACLGRPGVALCIGPQAAISKFQASLESAMPQKRFKTKVLDVPVDINDIHGFEPATLGEFRQVLASIDQEQEFFTLTGINPSNSNDNTGGGDSSGDNGSSEGRRKGGGGGKKKKKKQK